MMNVASCALDIRHGEGDVWLGSHGLLLHVLDLGCLLDQLEM